MIPPWWTSGGRWTCPPPPSDSLYTLVNSSERKVLVTALRTCSGNMMKQTPLVDMSTNVHPTISPPESLGPCCMTMHLYSSVCMRVVTARPTSEGGVVHFAGADHGHVEGNRRTPLEVDL
jgi:hypothetical protein